MAESLKMKNKIIIGIVIFLLIFLSYKYFTTQKSVEFSDNPKDWIKENKIDVFYASKGKSFLGVDSLQYIGDGVNTAFSLEGFYNGKKFLGEHKVNDKVVMRITSELNPNDGVIDGFIFLDLKKMKAYLFVDEDWKNYVGDTNILWGRKYQNEKKFVYKEVKKGIYMDEITDERSRFNEDFTISQGGIILGDISKDDAKDKTLIILR